MSKGSKLHPLESVLKELDYLIKSLEMEIDVAPTDRKAHQDLLRRINQVSAAALQIPDEDWFRTVNFTDRKTQEPTKEELEFLESTEWIAEGEIGEEIDVEAMNKRLKERGYEIQLSFPETPKD
ncbi:MAG: hypothetical protein KME05_12070 [Gloeocapsa sp. UFS-A4-WI-NPMV-4B04]|jgi:hypothetical protein|nr:hypothetical protein [Gloeocapsa sp. UFS-A4-WI-NPMV-4B04]